MSVQKVFIDQPAIELVFPSGIKVQFPTDALQGILLEAVERGNPKVALNLNNQEGNSIEWIKCHHGVEKRSLNGCEECRKERDDLFSAVSKKAAEAPSRIPIKRGCRVMAPCFCSGACQEIIGYRDPLFPGERP